MSFSHLTPSGKPQMVDVGDKAVTPRVAVAEATVFLGEEILRALKDEDFNSKKGSIIHTAVIAGTMAVKQTWATIPLCHAIPISGCSVEVTGAAAGAMKVVCEVRTDGKTGVEMEALHGATVAALTIYDMCKSMSHGIRIDNVHLVSKTGGKSDYHVG